MKQYIKSGKSLARLERVLLIAGVIALIVYVVHWIWERHILESYYLEQSKTERWVIAADYDQYDFLRDLEKKYRKARVSKPLNEHERWCYEQYNAAFKARGPDEPNKGVRNGRPYIDIWIAGNLFKVYSDVGYQIVHRDPGGIADHLKFYAMADEFPFNVYDGSNKKRREREVRATNEQDRKTAINYAERSAAMVVDLYCFSSDLPEPLMTREDVLRRMYRNRPNVLKTGVYPEPIIDEELGLLRYPRSPYLEGPDKSAYFTQSVYYIPLDENFRNYRGGIPYWFCDGMPTKSFEDSSSAECGGGFFFNEEVRVGYRFSRNLIHHWREIHHFVIDYLESAYQEK